MLGIAANGASLLMLGEKNCWSSGKISWKGFVPWLSLRNSQCPSLNHAFKKNCYSKGPGEEACSAARLLAIAPRLEYHSS